MRSVRESEKKSISEYLHGHVQSKLLVLQFRLTECQQVASADPDRVSSLLEEIRGDLKSIQEDGIRTVSHQLYPPSVMMGVVPALRSLQERFQHAVPIELRVDAAIQSREKDNRALFPEELRVGIYRIVEEALENIFVKDSRATRDKGLELYHEDDGFPLFSHRRQRGRIRDHWDFIRVWAPDHERLCRSAGRKL